MIYLFKEMAKKHVSGVQATVEQFATYAKAFKFSNGFFKSE